MAALISLNSEEVPFNPWARSVSTLSDFLYYCCPECDMKEKDMNDFVKHALLNHESAGLLKVFYPDVVYAEKEMQQTLRKTVAIKEEVGEDIFEEKSNDDYQASDNKEEYRINVEPEPSEFNEHDENFEVQGSTVMIKGEICEDEFENKSDEMDINEEEEDCEPGGLVNEENRDPQELADEDIPLVRRPSMFTRQQIQEMFQKYNVPFLLDVQKIKPEKLKVRLAKHFNRMLKKQHPIRQHIEKLTTRELRILHTDLLGPPTTFHKSKHSSLQIRIRIYYFKHFWTAPLTSFLRDKERLNLNTGLEFFMNTEIIPSVEDDALETEQYKDDYNELDENFEVQDSTVFEGNRNSTVFEGNQDSTGFEGNSNDDQTIDPLDNMEPIEDDTELIQEDYPIIKIPSTLSKEEIQDLHQKHKIPVCPYRINLSRQATYLEYRMKKRHPLRQHLSKMSLEELRALHTDLLGPVSKANKTQALRLRARILKYYFKIHRNAPLTCFLQDKEKLNLKEGSDNPKKRHVVSRARIHKLQKYPTVKCIINSRDPSDPSVVIHPEATRVQMIEELKKFGHDGRNLHTWGRAQARLQITLKDFHPIHQIIEGLSFEEIKAMIWYSGTDFNNRGLDRVRRQLASVCFAARPEAPISYFNYLQHQYRSLDPEDHKERVKMYRKQIRKQKKEELMAQCIGDIENNASQDSLDPLAN